jgi:hypothetical protein
MFMIAGCAQPREVLIYRPEFLKHETATAEPPSSVFDPPYLAHTTAFGRSEVAGVDLNYRAPAQATAGYFDQGENINYFLYYRDYHPGYHGHHGHHGHHSRLYRVFRYYRYGSAAR